MKGRKRMDSGMKDRTFWFPAKRYGWGWGPPVRWEGWAVLALYALLICLSAVLWLPSDSIAAFLLCTAGLTVALMMVCWIKGEPLRWRWGRSVGPEASRDHDEEPSV